MKRNLNPDQYQMSDNERENVWHAIRRETHGSAERRSPRSAFRPALAVTAVAATLTLMAVWQLSSRQITQDVTGDNIEIASLEVEKPISIRESKAVVAPAPPTPVLTGRVLDKESREPLAYANVLISGTSIGAVTDSLGVFRFENLPADQPVELTVKLLSYEPVEVALEMPTTGVLQHEFQLEPMIVATLQSFDVEGSEYMVEVKSGLAEHTVNSETFRKYAIDSVEDALNKKAGVVIGAGKVYVRGGRSGEVSMSVKGPDAAGTPPLRQAPPATAEPKRVFGSVTGGTTAPNGELVELMYFESTGVNPFVATEDDALSTFAVDVDNASWTLTRNYLARGMLPPRDAIRVEEFVNAFDAEWPHHTNQAFQIHTEAAKSRFGDGYHLLRIGLVGQDIDDSRRKPANLVFVVDVSGSMARESRLGTVKKALHILLDELREGDRVGIVVYGSRGEVRLPLTDISRRRQIATAIDGLQTNGSTNVAEGLELAYKMARESYDAGIINRLILCSDGVANTGRSTEAGGILGLVRKASDEGITLSTIGFGMGNYNDVLMEKLANQGDGNYFYVDKIEEAERVFRLNLTGLLQTIARQVKVQVEFDGKFVQRWRLLGYENRDVADKDFRNDQVDAGEVGAGHQVTALYEVKLTPSAAQRVSGLRIPGPAHLVGTVRLRHEAPAHDQDRAEQVTEIEQGVLLSQFEGDFADGTNGMKVQTVVAEFAELLRGSYWSRDDSLAELVPVAAALAEDMPNNEQVQELAQMIRQAAELVASKK